MAQSKSFFGLRRGSTKSLTFQVFEGKQVTKDRVYNVKNPQTDGQILQRMKLSPAQIFYANCVGPLLGRCFLW
jgi:outer membrane protein assembly factor BamA